MIDHGSALDAASAQLEGWVCNGTMLPHAPPIQATGTAPGRVAMLDANGVGGVRAPELDVPVATLTKAPAPPAWTLPCPAG